MENLVQCNLEAVQGFMICEQHVLCLIWPLKSNVSLNVIYFFRISHSSRDKTDQDPHGKITHLFLWKKSLSEDEMKIFTAKCSVEINNNGKDCIIGQLAIKKIQKTFLNNLLPFIYQVYFLIGVVLKKQLLTKDMPQSVMTLQIQFAMTG